MKLCLALVASIIFHTLWIFGWPLHLNVKANKLTLQNQTKYLSLNIVEKTPFSSVTIKQTTTKQKVVDKKTVDMPRALNPAQPALTASVDEKTQPPYTEEIASEATPSTENRLENTYSTAQYLSIKEVDIQAMPINNIDAAMLPQVALQNMQIKLRLFIDELGKVVHISPIKSQIYQNEALESALTQSLYQLSFTPAKRQGLDVKSYQDIAYDFSDYQANINR